MSMTFRGWPKDTLEFYVGLEADNSKSYWQAHRPVYDECVKAPFLALTEKSHHEFGPLHVFRPNRDVRFAKDKSPYKSAAAAVTESEGGAAYYVEISSEGLFVGSGYYHLVPDQLERFRAAVDDGRSGPKLKHAVDGAAQAALRGHPHANRCNRAPSRFPVDHPRVQTAAHEGHPRRPHVRRAGLAAQRQGARADHDLVAAPRR